MYRTGYVHIDSDFANLKTLYQLISIYMDKEQEQVNIQMQNIIDTKIRDMLTITFNIDSNKEKLSTDVDALGNFKYIP